MAGGYAPFIGDNPGERGTPGGNICVGVGVTALGNGIGKGGEPAPCIGTEVFGPVPALISGVTGIAGVGKALIFVSGVCCSLD